MGRLAAELGPVGMIHSACEGSAIGAGSEQAKQGEQSATLTPSDAAHPLAERDA